MGSKFRKGGPLLNIPKELRGELIKELRFIAKKIIEESDLRRKIYFYSAAYGMTRRVLNFTYDPQINFAEFVLEVTYNTINNRVQSIIQGDATIPLIDGFFDRLATYLEELALKIERDEDIYKTLEKIVALAHVTTGNGYYLFTKGLIKI